VKAVDVVHVHDCLYQASAFTVMAASMLRRRVLLTQHVGVVPYRQPALRLAQQLAYRGPGRLVLGRADQLTFVSPRVAAWFSGITHRARSAPVIPNGVATIFRPLSNPARVALRKELELPSTGPVLLFCGRFVEKKGLHLLEPVARRNPAWTWLFVGRPGDVDPSSWGLPNVRVLASMSPTRLAGFYQVADLLSLPSTGEGFPVAVQEAMACGTPAVVSNEFGDSLPESIAFATARDSAAIERTIRRALDAAAADPGLRDRVARYAHQQWDWDVAIDRYVALLGAITVGQQGDRHGAVANL
jgi:glycosyltransferase involved in cell wall biosynthesis